MALTIAMVAKNPFALYRAKEQFVAEHMRDVVAVDGMQEACQIRLYDGTVIKLLSESDWRRGICCRADFDQILQVGPEPLGIDFRLELNECLRNSCVPEEYQWQTWNGGGGDG